MDTIGGWSGRTRSPSRPAQLSRREGQIAQCVALGFTNRDIARSLEITEKTVEKHLTRIFAKLGLKSRAQLAIAVVKKETL